MTNEFFGFPRPDGQVGIRNHVLLLSGTLYANKLCERVSESVVGAIAVSHPLGRCQVRPDLRMTRRFLSNTGMNPNIAAVVVDRSGILEHDDFRAILAPQAILEVTNNTLRLEAGKYALTINRVHI